jgi:hypothetical protein
MICDAVVFDLFGTLTDTFEIRVDFTRRNLIPRRDALPVLRQLREEHAG